MALQPRPNIFLQAGIKPLDLDDLSDVEVRPAGAIGAPPRASAQMKESGLQKSDQQDAARQKRRPPTYAEFAASAGPRQPQVTGGMLPAPTDPNDPLIATGISPMPRQGTTKLPPPSTYERRAPQLSPMEDPMLGDESQSPSGAGGMLIPVSPVGVGARENQWGPVIDDATARQAEGLRAASDQMSETYAQDAAVRDQLAGLQGGLIPPAFDLKERAQKRALMAADRLDQASKVYLGQVYQGLDSDRVFGPGRLNRATLLAASIGNGNQLYSTGVQAPDMMRLIEDVVDRDLDIQQAEIDNRGQAANSLLAQLQVALGDKDMAADAFRMIWHDMIKAEMEAMVPRTADAQQRAAMVEKIGQLDMVRAEARAKLEEAYLGRELDAQKTTAGNIMDARKANAANAAKLGKEARDRELDEYKMAGQFHKQWGTAVTSIRGAQRLQRLMREALQKFGHVPGMGNLFLAGTVEEVRKYMEQLQSGAVRDMNENERRAALDIAQAALEWQHKKFKSAAQGTGAQSDFDVAIMRQIYDLLAKKDQETVFNILDNDVRETGNEYVRASRQALPPNVRRRAIEQNLPEWLSAQEKSEAPSPTRGPRYQGQRDLD